VLLFATAGAPALAREQSRGALLDVPYLSQPVRLCGGAALAMVLRFWGEPQVFAEDFAPLVDQRRGGIPAEALARAVSDRGWTAVHVALEADRALTQLRDEVNSGRPVIALIEDRPSLYHFVVVVGVTSREVVLHDPARAPFQVLPHADFDAAWARAERWMLVVMPPAARPAEADAGDAAARVQGAAGPCDALVSHSVSQAQSGDLPAAERGLSAATALCPGDAAGWRELAGLRFLEREYPETLRLAGAAIERAPGDAHAWQLVATSRYLTGDRDGALDAWNRTGEPRTDVVNVDGAVRTPHTVVVNLVDLPPRELLTSGARRRAEQRLEELPVASDATVRYEPLDDGWAAVNVSIDERRILPENWMGWGATTFETLLQREVSVNIPGRLGAGENLRLRYRWAANRPRALFEFGAPAPGPLPGIVTTELWWERQAYTGLESGAPVLREQRVRTGGHLADWPVDWFRWQAGAAIDRFDGRRHVSVNGRLVTRLFDDHVSVTAHAERWAPANGGSSFAAAGATAAWRSSANRDVPGWIAFGGMAEATRAAPLAIWPGAGTSLTRGALLRAHSVTDGGIVSGAAFGRRLAFTTVEHQRPVWSSPHGLASVAIFLDLARAWDRRDGTASPWLADLGAGIRFGEPNADTVRLDIAVGLRDRRVTVSAGYVPDWGR
jgi:hypothetical protein